MAPRDVSWADCELIVRIRGDRSGVRLTYRDGVLELMSPSVDHWTSGGIDRLEVYRGPDLGEVWFWPEGVIEVHGLARIAHECASGCRTGGPRGQDPFAWRVIIRERCGLVGERYERRERGHPLPERDRIELARQR